MDNYKYSTTEHYYLQRRKKELERMRAVLVVEQSVLTPKRAGRITDLQRHIIDLKTELTALRIDRV